MSKFELRAFSPEGGFAIVKYDGRYIALRPPYNLEAGETLLRAEVYQAIAYHGFRAVRKKFETWEALLVNMGEEAKRPLMVDELRATAAEAFRLLQTMTVEDYKNHLQSVDTWMKEGELEQARKLLMDLLRAPLVYKTPLFFVEVNERLRKIEMELKSFQAACGVIHSGSVDDLRRDLKRVRFFLRHEKKNEARRLLDVISTAPAVSRSPELFGEISELFRRCEARRNID